MKNQLHILDRNSYLCGPLLMILILKAVGVIHGVDARIGATTKADGIFGGGEINRYLSLNQTSGFRLESIPAWQAKDSAEEFTLLAWFKLDKYPWDPAVSSNMNIVYLSNDNLKCEIQTSRTIDCFQSRAATSQGVFRLPLATPSEPDLNGGLLVQLGQWYLLVLKSRKQASTQQTTMSLYDESFTNAKGSPGPILESTQSTFHPYQAMTKGYQFTLYVGLGRGSDKEGFVGSIRQVQMVSRYLGTIQLVKNAAFSQLSKAAEPDLLLQVSLFNTTTGLIDEVSKVQGQLAGVRATSGGVTPQIDFNSQFLCRDIDRTQLPSYVKFDASDDFSLQPYRMSSAVYSDSNSNSGDYRVTLEAWVQRATSSTPSQQVEVLFDHLGIHKLEFEPGSYDKLTVTHLSQYRHQVDFPRGEWIFIASWHDATGFGIHVEDQNGKVYSTGGSVILYSPRRASYATNSQVEIAKKFNGYIQGMKYFKGLSRRAKKAYDFGPAEETDEEALWYFRFQKDGIKEPARDQVAVESNQFANKVVLQSTEGNAITANSASVEKYLAPVLTRNLTDPYRYTSLGWETEWDGVACTAGQKHLFFQEASNYVRTEFQLLKEDDPSPGTQVDLAKEYKDITIEFWFRPVKPSAGPSTLLTLMRDGRPLLQITRASKASLACFPYQDWQPTINKPWTKEQLLHGVQYFDYEDAPVWQHLSCAVDSKQSVLRGTIFSHNSDGRGPNVEHGYVKDTKTLIDKFSLRQDSEEGKFQLLVNSDGAQGNGMQNTYYADVRVWNVARSWSQIKQYRNQLINYKSDIRFLLSAVQLLGEGRMNAVEPDLAQIRLAQVNLENDQAGLQPVSSFASFVGAQWKEDETAENSLLLCPLQTFVDYASMTCHRDGVLKLSMVFFRDQEAKQYVLTPRFSQFATAAIEESREIYYSFHWKLIRQSKTGSQENSKVIPATIESQENAAELRFHFGELQSQGEYQIQLIVKDNHFKQQEDLRELYLVAVQDCVEFHDATTGRSESIIQVNSDKGSEDVLLKMERKGCGAYQTPYAAMTYRFVDEATRPPQNQGTSFLDDTKTLRVGKQAQSFMPVNQDIVIIVTANWYDQLILSVAYTLRWDTRVSLKVTTPYLLVPLGSPVSLFTNETKVINYSGKEDALAYSVTWDCPKNLKYSRQEGDDYKDLCSKEAQGSLHLTPADFAQAKLSYWEPYTIEATSQSAFIQSDGSWGSSDSIVLTWIPFNPEAGFIGDDTVASDQILNLEVATNGIGEEKTRFEWTTTPYIDPGRFGISGDSRTFVVAPYVLSSGRTYNFSVEIQQKATGRTVWRGSKQVRVEPAASSRRIVVTPFQGSAFDNLFTLEAHAWGVSGAEYQFMYEDISGQFSPITALSSRSWVTSQLPPTRKILVKVVSPAGAVATATSTLYCPFEDEAKTLVVQETLFQAALSQWNEKDEKFLTSSAFRTSMSKFSLLSNNFNTFSSYHGFQTSKLQAKKIFEVISKQAQNLDAQDYGLSSGRLSESDQVYFTQSVFSIFGLLTKSEVFFKQHEMNQNPFKTQENADLLKDQRADHKLLEEMQQIQLQLLDQGSRNARMLQLLKRDRTLHANIVQVQANILNELEIQAEKKQIPSLIYGFKDPRVMNITQMMREILSNLEHFIGRGLDVGQTYRFSTGLIELHIHKFNGRVAMADQDLTFGEFNITIPLKEASLFPGYRTLALMVFRSNPFFGSYYHMADKQTSKSNDTDVTDKQNEAPGVAEIPQVITQEVRSNVTAYVSWRDQRGASLDTSDYPGLMEMEFEYHFPNKANSNESFETQLTHCADMSPDQPLAGRKPSEFGQEKCNTVYLYNEDKIKCSCRHQSYFTISRDEFLQPFSEAQGNFDFKNWASFGVFAYLMLLLIFGIIVTQNMDLRDVAKMNDMDAGEDVEYAGIENEQIQFPLSAYALKRQVYLMNFAHEDLTQSKLFIIFLAHFHPLLTFKFRFDPNLSRQDRFLVLFLQISLTLFASFMLFRNLDKPTNSLSQSGGALDLPLESLIAPLICTFAFSFFLLGPLPTALYDCLCTKYILDHVPDFSELDENEFFQEEEQPLAAGFGPAINQDDNSDHEAQIDVKHDGLPPLHVDPNIPLKFLFQISAFSVEYLKKKGKKRFPFLGGDRSDVGRALLPKEEPEGEKKESNAGKSEGKVEEGKKEEGKRAGDRKARRNEKKQRQRNRDKRNRGGVNGSQENINDSEEGDNLRQRQIHEKKGNDVTTGPQSLLDADNSQRQLVEGSFIGAGITNQADSAGQPGKVNDNKLVSRREAFQKQKQQGATNVPHLDSLKHRQSAPAKGREGGRGFSTKMDRQALDTEPADAVQLEDIQLRIPVGNDVYKEGGASDDASSVNTENMEEPNNEFTEDTGATRTRLNRVRLLLYVLIAGLLLTVLVVYSLEGIHSTTGRTVWVGVFFASQAVGFLCITPLWILALASFVLQQQERKEFLSKYFYNQLVLVEDFKHVQHFQSQKFG